MKQESLCATISGNFQAQIQCFEFSHSHLYHTIKWGVHEVAGTTYLSKRIGTQDTGQEEDIWAEYHWGYTIDRVPAARGSEQTNKSL